MRSFRSTAIYLPGILLPRLASLGLIVVMTHLLPKAEYGLLTLVVTVGELVDSSLTTWVRLALLRLGGNGNISHGLAAVVLRSVAVTTALGGVLSLVLALVLVPDRPFLFWVAVFTYILAISILRFGLALLQLSGRSVTYSLLEIGRAALSFTVAVGIAAVTGHSFFLPSLAIGCSIGVFAALAVRKGSAGLAHTHQQFGYRDITAFAGPLLILSVLTIVINAMDRLVLQFFGGATAVAGYAAVYALARQPVDVLANALNAGGYPALVGHYERGGRAEAAEFLRHQLGFFAKFVLPPAGVLLLVQHDLAAALLPAAYMRQSSAIFSLILAGAVAFNLRSVIFDNIFLVTRQNMLQLRYFVVVFLIGFAIALVGVPRLGMIGAALIFVSWTTLALGMSVVTGRRLIAFVPPAAELCHATLLTAVSCGAVVLAMRLMTGQPPFTRLAAEGVAAVLAYGAILAGIHRHDLVRVMSARLRRAN